MEILEDKILAKNIFQKYTVNPKDWSFVISTTSMNDGFFDATITNPDEVWQLKIDSLCKPMPIITGTKIDIESTKMKIITIITTLINIFQNQKDIIFGLT